MGPWDAAASALTQFLDAYGLAAIIVLMLVKEIGVPVPIPSDVVMLAAAAQSASGRFVLWQAFGLILVAMIVGAWVQFLLARRLGRAFLSRFGHYVGLTDERLETVAVSVRRGGATAVALSLLTPGVRVATVPASGIARMPHGTFVSGLAVGSAGFLALHFLIGYAAGPVLDGVLRLVGVPVLAVVALLLVVGLAGWLAMRRRAGAGEGRSATLERLRDWENAACPACLTIGVVHHLRHAEASDKVEAYPYTKGAIEMAGEENKAIGRRFLEGFNTGDMARVEEFIAADCRFLGPGTPPGLKGPEGYRQIVQTYRKAFPDMRVSIDKEIAEGDRVAISWHAEGTHRGELFGIMPTNKSGRTTAVHLFTVTDGKLHEAQIEWDMLGLMEQLGVVPAAGESGQRAA